MASERPDCAIRETPFLTGKRVLVTGAGRGVGHAIACRCAELGAVVAVNVRQSDPLLLEQFAPNPVHEAVFDVRHPADVGKAIDRCVAKLGGVDILVNNAGAFRPGLLHRTTIDDIACQIDTLLLGPLYCSRAVLPHMIAQAGGFILNIGSIAAARPTRGQATYAAAKGGLDALTRAVALEYAARGIRAVCLRLGPVDSEGWRELPRRVRDDVTGRIAVGRVGTLREAADFAAFLMSDKASFASGAIYDFDGGYV